MRKSLIFALALVLVVAFVAPSFAFENVFGGYWRTRWSWQQGWSNSPPDPKTLKFYDTRTRLYYTAKFSDDFSFVNKFEWNVTWGDNVGGDIGTDGTGIFRIKNSYADFRTGQFRHTVGLQGQVIARGFLFDDDFAGYVARYQPGTTGDLLVPLAWIRAEDGLSRGGGSTDDHNTWAVYPFIPIGDTMVLNPYWVYQHSNGGAGGTAIDDDPMWLGLDFDMKSDAFSLWASGIANFGDASPSTSYGGFLLAAGVDFNLGMAGLWVDAIYATGEESGGDIDAFVNPSGASYYWAEILGLGIFDQGGPGVAPDNKISNLMTIGVGADWKLGDKFKLSTDLWYAKLAEDDSFGKSDLGFEIDVILTWALVENLNLDLVAAYLSAGDALFADGKANENPIEVGARMSFSF